MINEPQTFIHPISKQKLIGYRLEPGDKIEPTDMYDSSSGNWACASPSIVGLTLGPGTAAIWVRV